MRTFGHPIARTALGMWATASAAFHLYSVGVGLLDSRYQRAIHFLFVLPLAFLLYPAGPRSPRDRPSLADLLLALAALSVNGYLILQAEHLNLRWEGVSWPSPSETLVATMAVVLTLEAARRAAGLALAVLTLAFVAWLFASSYVFTPADASLATQFIRTVEVLALFQGEGLYGGLLGVAATYIALYVLFGALIEKTGAAGFFTDLARLAVGRTPGSAGKMAALSSALFGTVAGQGTANVYTTGTFTIPFMIKKGYTPEFAAGLEATASMGGALLPPVMGTAAFVMADFLGISMSVLMKRALVPALFYFAAILFVVHLDALRRGDRGESADARPHWRTAIARAHLVIPLVVLVAVLLSGYSALVGGLVGVASAVAICGVQTRGLRAFGAALGDVVVQATRNTVMVSISCACAGIVVAAVAYSGLAVMFGTSVIALAGASTPAVLGLTMILTLILGTGLPATPAYILTVSLLAPSLAVLGAEALLIHLFVFYFAILSDVSPPVCMTTYAAAGIANAEPMRASVEGLRLSFAGFLVPFAFMYRPGITLAGSWMTILRDVGVVTLIVAVAAVALTGWFKVPLTWLERTILLLAAVALVSPAPAFLLGGFGLLALAGAALWTRLALSRRSALRVGVSPQAPR